ISTAHRPRATAAPHNCTPSLRDALPILNGIAAPVVAVEPAPEQVFWSPRRRVSVVMVVYMTGEALEQSVRCVLADPLVDEFVIVDNGSPGRQTAMLQALAERD